jgi:chromosome segregation ATPase
MRFVKGRRTFKQAVISSLIRLVPSCDTQFFIRGTQLQQLTDEYEEINANIVMSKTLLDKKREDLPELFERAKAASKNLKEVREASQAQEKITQVQKELTWLYVAEATAVSKRRYLVIDCINF